MLYEKIGRKIKTLRKLQGMTQDELSSRAGISLSFLGHIERGTRKLSVETLYALCMALDCSADQLLETGKTPTANESLRALLLEALDMLEN